MTPKVQRWTSLVLFGVGGILAGAGGPILSWRIAAAVAIGALAVLLEGQWIRGEQDK